MVISLVASAARSARRGHLPAYLYELPRTVPCVRFNKALRFSLCRDERETQRGGWSENTGDKRPSDESSAPGTFSIRRLPLSKLSVHCATHRYACTLACVSSSFEGEHAKSEPRNNLRPRVFARERIQANCHCRRLRLILVASLAFVELRVFLDPSGASEAVD